MGILQAKKQFVGPRLVHQSRLEHHGFVVVSVVEAAEPSFLIADGGVGEVGPLRLHLIIVVGIVLIHIEPDHEPALAGPSKGDVAAMGVERAIAVAGIDVGAWTVVGDDVDDTADGIAAEVDGHHTFIHLQLRGKACGDVVQSEAGVGVVHRHAVEEHLDMLACESVEVELNG